MKEKVHLFDLPSEVYEHPFDRKALKALKALPGLDTVTNFILNWVDVKWDFIAMQGSNFHVTRESCLELYNQIREVAAVLGVKDFPEIYTKWSYQINGYTTGNKDTTMLVLYSGAIDLLTDEQLDYVVGHEMGHIKSGHVLYHLMAQLISSAVAFIPLGKQALLGVQAGLLYWERMSEFTADRAGLLACQDKEAAIDAIIKTAGAPQKLFGKLDHEAFKKQAEEFETRFSGVANDIMKNVSIMTSTHPWNVYRAGELLKWIESGEYDRILREYGGAQCVNCDYWVAKNATVCPRCGLNPFE